jgi:hypothetical protein
MDFNSSPAAAVEPRQRVCAPRLPPGASAASGTATVGAAGEGSDLAGIWLSRRQGAVSHRYS